MAEGVLLLVWGRATGLVPYLQEYPKHYRARVRFGRITNTQDRTGTVLEDRDPGDLREEVVRAALGGFRGVISQVPPAFSALKRNGRRLYEAARAGETVVVEARERTVFKLELTEWDPPFAELEVVCSGGTYVRTLAHDLGRVVGPGASLEKLQRTAIGPYLLSRAVNPDLIDLPFGEGLLPYATSPSEALPDWPRVRVKEEEAKQVVNGSWTDVQGVVTGPGRYVVLDEEDQLLALIQGGRLLRYLRVFGQETPVP